MIDPSGDVQGQAGILNALQGELAQAMVERDMILSYADAKDQRVVQADRRIDAISDRIEAERDAMESGGVDGALPDVVGALRGAPGRPRDRQHRLYPRARRASPPPRPQARRQSRYLAPHIQPTLAAGIALSAAR